MVLVRHEHKEAPYSLSRIISLALLSSQYILGVCSVSSDWFFQTVHAQVLLNGQVFTNGLAIVDAPAPNRCGMIQTEPTHCTHGGAVSILHTGSSMSLAIDVCVHNNLRIRRQMYVIPNRCPEMESCHKSRAQRASIL